MAAARVATGAMAKDDKCRGRQRRKSATPHSNGGSNSQARQPTTDSKRGPGRPRSKSNVVASQPSVKCTPRIVARSQSSDVELKAKALERDLHERLDELTLSKSKTKHNASAVNLIQEIILQHLEDDDRSLKWKTCKSGSYYERTKINKPDEYDCMMVCDIRCKPDYSCSDDTAFCSLRSLAINGCRGPNYPISNPQLMTNPTKDGTIYVSPTAFKEHFRSKILGAIEKESSGQLKDLQISVQLSDPGCPAVTLTVRGQRGSPVQRLSIDIVPAIRLLEWPEPARTWRFRRNQNIEYDIKHPDESQLYPFAVAKIHHTEQMRAVNECRPILWRISFSEAEKKLILHADQRPSNGSASAHEPETCRKSVLRLLKADLQEFKVNNEDNDALCSFHIKTTFLHLIDKVPDASLWTEDHLLARYTDGLRMLVEALQKGEIRHYFIRSANILDPQNCKRRQMKVLEQYFNGRLAKYSV